MAGALTQEQKIARAQAEAEAHNYRERLDFLVDASTASLTASPRISGKSPAKRALMYAEPVTETLLAATATANDKMVTTTTSTSMLLVFGAFFALVSAMFLAK